MRIRQGNGFTLVELMCATVIFAAMIAGLTASLLAGRSSWMVTQNAIQVQTQARNVLWRMAKDLRQVKGTPSLTQNATAVTLTFTHPTDGQVTYSWAAVTKQVARATSSATKIIAQNITALSFTDGGTNMTINLTASGTSTDRKTATLSLKEKVGYRQ